MSSLILEGRGFPVVVRHCFCSFSGGLVSDSGAGRRRCMHEALTHVNHCAHCGTASRGSSDHTLLVKDVLKSRHKLVGHGRPLDGLEVMTEWSCASLSKVWRPRNASGAETVFTRLCDTDHAGVTRVWTPHGCRRNGGAQSAARCTCTVETIGWSGLQSEDDRSTNVYIRRQQRRHQEVPRGSDKV